MKKIFLIIIILFLTGCSDYSFSEEVINKGIDLINSGTMQKQDIDNAYIYECDLLQFSNSYELDEHICIDVNKHIICDEILVADDENEDIKLYDANNMCQNIPSNLRQLDANYNFKELDTCVGYLEKYFNEVTHFQLVMDCGKYEITESELVYIVRCYGPKYYLIPVYKMTVKGYGVINIEVNSGCIVW